MGNPPAALSEHLKQTCTVQEPLLPLCVSACVFVSVQVWCDNWFQVIQRFERFV